MRFGAHLERAPTVRKQASPGQARQERRPGSCVHQGPSPERATHVVTPLQGLVRDGRFSQGVALGWVVAGPLALKASSFAKCMTGSGPEQEPKGMVGKPARPARLPSRPLANAFGVAQRRLVLVLGGQPDRGQERGGASLRERGNGRAPLFNPPRRITLLTFTLPQHADPCFPAGVSV
jgi:hypothetical protein